MDKVFWQIGFFDFVSLSVLVKFIEYIPEIKYGTLYFLKQRQKWLTLCQKYSKNQYVDQETFIEQP